MRRSMFLVALGLLSSCLVWQPRQNPMVVNPPRQTLPDLTPASPVTAPPWETVTTDQLRRWRGDFGGLVLPEIAPHCPEDPVTGIRCVGTNGRTARGVVQGMFFGAHYGNYTADQRRLIRAAYKARGYTHIPIGIDTTTGTDRDYNGIYPPNRLAVSTQLRELWNDGLIPACFVLSDDEHASDVPAKAALLDDRDLCRIVVAKWEINDPDHGDTDRINAEILAVRAAFPHALLYAHFTPEHSAGGSPEADWWRWFRDVAHGTGSLWQDDKWDDVSASIANAADMIYRLGGDGNPAHGGYHGWPTGLDVVLFESQVYTQFWDGRSEAESLAYSRAVLSAVMDRDVCIRDQGRDWCGRAIGFGNGG